jgi:density-regulated protein
MAEVASADAPPAREAPPPVVVTYDPLTGIPAEFNEYLPTNCDEFKRHGR